MTSETRGGGIGAAMDARAGRPPISLLGTEDYLGAIVGGHAGG